MECHPPEGEGVGGGKPVVRKCWMKPRLQRRVVEWGPEVAFSQRGVYAGCYVANPRVARIRKKIRTLRAFVR